VDKNSSNNQEEVLKNIYNELTIFNDKINLQIDRETIKENSIIGYKIKEQMPFDFYGLYHISSARENMFTRYYYGEMRI
jgi:hypothetical protein